MAARVGVWLLPTLLGLGLVGCPRPQKAVAPSDAGPSAAARANPELCEHKVPSALCTRCNPDLAAVFQDQEDWCEEHGVPESQCLECNPSLTFQAPQAPRDWCKEHAVPESKCTKCHPKLVAQFIEAGDYCREHGFPESVCPYCHPELVAAAGAAPPSFPTAVKLASQATAKEAGLRTQVLQRRPFARTLEVVGQLEFDQNRLFQLSARGEALILEVKVDVGDEVKAGQPLVVLASAQVGQAQGQLSAAEAQVMAAAAAVRREEGLVQEGVSPRKNLEQAQADLAAAQGALSAARAGLGAAGAGTAGSGGRYVLAAPFAGTVVARDAVAGRSASFGQVLIEVADLSTLWAQLEIPEAEAGDIRVGQGVLLTLEGSPGAPLPSTIARVGASVDRATRTVRARVELPNESRSLKAGRFVRARIQVSAEREALMVPRGALQRAEGRTLVFVKKSEAVFEPVVVEVGAGSAEWVEILKGLSPGAEVVTTGAFLLKTEILKESIGAGCCDEGGGE